MKVVNHSSVYSFILDEMEWYGASEQQREAWINQIMRESAEYRCQYATILVEPDAIMSISPNSQRHKVWGHTYPSDNEHVFRAELTALRHATLETLTPERMAFIAREVFQ